jgi:O-antigen/teichoic acid export membrane protein
MMVGIGLGFVTQMLMARGMGASDYGIYNFIFTLASFIAIFGVLGFETSSIRHVSITVLRNADGLPPLLRGKYFLTIFTTCICALLVFGLLFLIHPQEPQLPSACYTVGSVISVFMVLLRLNSGILRGFQHGTQSVFYEITLREILLLLALGALLLVVPTPWTAQTGLIVLASVYVIAGLASFIATQHDYSILAARHQFLPERAAFQKVVYESLPLMMMNLSRRLMQRLDIIILGLMLPPALVGVYALATLFADAATLASRPTLAYFSPRAAALFEAGSFPELQKLFWQATYFIGGIHTVTAVCIAVIAPFFLPYFGADFPRGIYALWILLGGITLSAVMGPVGNLMIMAGYSGAALRITAAMAVCNILFTPLATYFASIEGAALSSSLLIVLWNILCWRHIRAHKILSGSAHNVT